MINIAKIFVVLIVALLGKYVRDSFFASKEVKTNVLKKLHPKHSFSLNPLEVSKLGCSMDSYQVGNLYYNLRKKVLFSEVNLHELRNIIMVGGAGNCLYNFRPIIETFFNIKYDEYTWLVKRKNGISSALKVYASPISIKVFLKSIFLRKIKKIPIAYSTVNLNSKGYYHWIIEDLPRLAGYFEYCKITSSNPKILIDKDPPQWKIDTLLALGINQKNLEIYNDDYIYHIEKLVLTDPMFQYCHVPSRMSIEWLRCKILSSRKVKKCLAKRIYISRENSKYRKVSNEDAVMSLLERYGFQKYNLEHLSFDKKIDLFSNAEFIIGAHGAGLLHMIFSENAKVIELIDSMNVRSHQYYCLSSIMRHNYFYVCGKPISDLNGAAKEFNIDIKCLKNVLDQIIN
jgi:hypothetical protein